MMYAWKFSSKFGVSTVNAIGQIAVVVVGGILVIDGQSDVGTVVACSIGLVRVQPPITALIANFRHASSKVVNYDLLVDATGDPFAT